MYDALYIGATGMQAHERQVDAIAQNLANVSTPGFRRQLVTFAELTAALSPVPVGEANGVGLASQAMAGWNGQGLWAVGGTEALNGPATRGVGSLATVSLSQRAGELRQTGEVLDIAIDGAGYLEVIMADGSPAYTRAGSLRVSAEGELTTPDGSLLASGIEIPPDARNIVIQPDGTVLAQVGDEGSVIELGVIELMTFANPAGLEATGESLYVATSAAGEPTVGTPGEDGVGTLRQGYLESSNVQLVDELVSLMLAQRAFEMNSRVLQAADQLMAITNGLYRT